MIFPFEITFKKKLVGDIEKFSTQEILDFAKKDFEYSKANRISLKDNTLIAENPFKLFGIIFGISLNRWAGVSKANFSIHSDTNYRIATYKFNLARLLLNGILIGLAFGISLKSYIIAIVGFGVIGMLNWIIKIIQHWICFDGTFTDLIFVNRNKSS